MVGVKLNECDIATLVPSSVLVRADFTGTSYSIFPNSSICPAFF